MHSLSLNRHDTPCTDASNSHRKTEQPLIRAGFSFPNGALLSDFHSNDTLKASAIKLHALLTELVPICYVPEILELR